VIVLGPHGNPRGGRKGVSRLIFTLGRIADECQMRAATRGSSDYGTLGARAHALGTSLTDAEQRKAQALADLKAATQALTQAYLDATVEERKLAAAIYSMIGPNAQELALFGLTLSVQGRRLQRSTTTVRFAGDTGEAA
jgi:hypothetical protein